MDRTFLLLGALFAFLAIALGAFGSHALRAKLSPERLGQFDIGVRYQLWHALGLFVVVLVGAWRPAGGASAMFTVLEMGSPATTLAGWLFVAGIVLFSGSLYALAVTGVRKWGMVTPFGGACFLAGWLALAFAVATR